MNKKIVSVLIALVIVASGLWLLTTASSTYSLEITNIHVCNNEQSVIELGEGTYEVKVDFKALADVTNPFVAVLLCEGDENSYTVVDFNSDTSLVLAEGETDSITVEIICKNPEKSFLKVMTTAGKSSSRRICEDGIFPTGNELKLSCIEISGMPLDGFDSDIFEYKYYPSLTEQLPIEVNITKNCDVVDAEINIPETYPGDITITLTYPGYTPITYRINVAAPAPKVTIDSIGEVSVDKNCYKVVNDIGINDIVHPDKQTYISDFGTSSLEGTTLITTNWQDGRTSSTAGYSELLTFTIDNSAEVYIAYASEYIGSSHMWWRGAYSQCYDENGNKVVLTVSDGTSNTTYFLFKRNFEMMQGETTTITLQTVGAHGVGNYLVFVKWIDNYNDELVETLTDSEGRTVSITTNPSRWSLEQGIVMGKTNAFNDYPDIIKYSNVTGVDLSDAIAVKALYADGSDSVNVTAGSEPWATLEINSSAKIYVLSPFVPNTEKWVIPFLVTEGYTPSVTDESGNPVATLDLSNGRKYFVYEKYYPVDEGQTVTVNLGRQGRYGNGSMYTVALKWLEDDSGGYN